jgi:two-component system, chemotaxis family, protein-glutamate methylesterase/glutaminase
MRPSEILSWHIVVLLPYIFDMATRDIVVIGASAGGVQALKTFVATLPADFQATIFIVLHLPPYSETQMPEILNRAGKLPAVQARNNDPFEKGHIYIAPPDRHLLLKPDKMVLEAGPRENFNRPAIDPLFRSAARSFGPRVIGVVLSGMLDDGTAGLQEIQAAGGIAIVQDPEDALYRSMPENALDHLDVDYREPVSNIGPLLCDLIQQEIPRTIQLSEPPFKTLQLEDAGAPSVYSCPDCGGVLWELAEPNLVRFRCRVGHTYGPESLSARQSEDVERALWTALTSLEESAAFSRRLAARAWQRGDRHTAFYYEERMKKAEANAAHIRGLLIKGTVAQPSTEETQMQESER